MEYWSAGLEAVELSSFLLEAKALSQTKLSAKPPVRFHVFSNLGPKSSHSGFCIKTILFYIPKSYQIFLGYFLR